MHTVEFPTGAGASQLTTERGGNTISTGRKYPELTGMSGHSATSEL
jgi:hypothetical protein